MALSAAKTKKYVANMEAELMQLRTQLEEEQTLNANLKRRIEEMNRAFAKLHAQLPRGD